MRPSALALVVANLFPLVGVIWLGWDIFSLLLLFWLENVVIGVFNVLKMLLVSAPLPGKSIVSLFLIPFFIIHFGLFTMAHGFVLFKIFSGALELDGSELGHLMGATLGEIKNRQLFWPIVALVVSHGVSFIGNAVIGQELQRTPLLKLMFQPYSRIIIMHITIIFGAFLAHLVDNGLGALVVLIGMKIVVDLRSHFEERNRFASEEMV